jgi:uncharacterized circularly permuted ATP-grasp superfamily protein/uncharacterized alpha-E superfamily protein
MVAATDDPSPATAGEGLREGSITWNEMRGPDGAVRPHWQVLDRALNAFGPGEMWRRWEQARQLIRQHGVSFNVYGDARGLDRPWPLDPVPVVLAPDEFASLAAGLAQRATLLDRLIADIYGPKRMIAEGLLPPEVVLGHPGLLRACAGLVPPGGKFLHFYAADLVRTPEGELRVLADRTQAPAGAGYALENRIVLGRVLPEAFRECHAQRLAPFFRTLRDTLAALAPHGRDNPRIVLLTAGPHNATYFEQAFLAQYLGYPLVEGGDLTVRDGRVFLKTLGGLHPVDVILRRLNDDWCDPLELRAESLLGVPGLLQAARDGQVAIANALGAGVAQTPALTPFLPSLCRALLGEELRLGSVETWWCGQPDVLSHVLDHLGEMVIKPAYPGMPGGPVEPGEPVFGARLDSDASEKLAAAIRAAPGRFVAQRRVMPSTVPVIEGDELKPRSLVLRAFVVADGVDGYETMPGALAVVGGAADEIDISIARGARSKDTWVISDGEVSEFSLLRPPAQPVAPTRGGGDLPSRVADNFFWLGRYAERAEAIARLARVICMRLADRGRRAFAADFAPLVAALRTQTRVASGLANSGNGAGPTSAEPERAVREALYDPQHEGTLFSTAHSVERVARSVRDRLSMDSWSVVVALQNEIGDGERTGRDERLLVLAARLDRMIMILTALAGFTSESVMREAAWRFLDMGRRLERALNTALVIEQALAIVRPDEAPLLEALLDTADSAMTYRRRYRATLQVPPVVDLLAADEGNPRSIVFQLAALAEHVSALPREPTLARRSPEERIAFEALSAFRLIDVDAVCAPDGDMRPALRDLCAGLVANMQRLSDALSGRYLAPATVSRSLAWPGPST